MGKLLVYKSKMPEPTFENPYAQVEWVFGEIMSLQANKNTKSNYQAGCSFYLRFLNETDNYNEQLTIDPRFYLAKEWNAAALLKVQHWLEATNLPDTENYLTSYTVMGNFSAVRKTMEYAFEYGYISGEVFNVAMPGAVAETEQRTAYSDEEHADILRTVAPLISFSKNLLNSYRRTNKGQDPRKLNRKGCKPGDKLIGQSWLCLKPAPDKKGEFVICDDNMRWYFENVMNCVPLAGTLENKKSHKTFFSMATNHFGGLNELYKKWGVSSYISQDVIMPLVVELSALTGLNVESTLSLPRDCFVKAHPLTNLPYLQYNKPRSGGEKELPLSLYDQVGKGDSVKLGQKQSQIIAKSIDTILKLTEPLVSNAAAADKDFLLLYQSTGQTSFGKIKRVNQKTITNWMSKTAVENNLRGTDGKPLVFNLSRFRPTKFTKMVKDGNDIFHIMAIAGHASVSTTLGYIDRLKTTGDFHNAIGKALVNIKNNKIQQERRQLPVANQPNAKPGNFIFKGSFCNCKNPYDPPEKIKKAANYHEGDACTYWNQCLQCENVLITENNLPKLMAYHSEINRALANGVDDMPRHGEIYKKTAAILDQILKPDVLFSKENLSRASQNSEPDEYETIDAFVY